MPRFEKCNHCRYGWNNPHGCNYPDPLDPCRIDMSCYQPMTEAQKFQQKAERERKSDKTNNTKLVGKLLCFGTREKDYECICKTEKRKCQGMFRPVWFLQ